MKSALVKSAGVTTLEDELLDPCGTGNRIAFFLLMYLCPDLGQFIANNWASVVPVGFELSSALNLMASCQLNLLGKNFLPGSWTRTTKNTFTLSIN